MRISFALLLGVLTASSSAAYASCKTVGAVPHQFAVCEYPVSRLEVFWNERSPDGNPSLSAIDASLARRGDSLLFAMNGGIFGDNFRPRGLLVSHGKTLVPVNACSSPADRCDGNFGPANGVFWVSQGVARIEKIADYQAASPSRPAPDLAIQSGPVLLDKRVPISGFQRKGGLLTSRNAVCVRHDGSAAFVVADQANGTTIPELADFMATLDCESALYLDGCKSVLLSKDLRRADPIACVVGDRRRLSAVIGVASSASAAAARAAAANVKH